MVAYVGPPAPDRRRAAQWGGERGFQKDRLLAEDGHDLVDLGPGPALGQGVHQFAPEGEDVGGAHWVVEYTEPEEPDD